MMMYRLKDICALGLYLLCVSALATTVLADTINSSKPIYRNDEYLRGYSTTGNPIPFVGIDSSDDTRLNCASGSALNFTQNGASGARYDPSDGSVTFLFPHILGSDDPGDGVTFLHFTDGFSSWAIVNEFDAIEIRREGLQKFYIDNSTAYVDTTFAVGNLLTGSESGEYFVCYDDFLQLCDCDFCDVFIP